VSRAELESLIRAALLAASPGECLRKHWPSDLAGPVSVLAIGKASLSLAEAARAVLGDRLAGGVATAPPELALSAGGVLPGWDVFAADHPLATERNVQAARAVVEFVRAVPRVGTLLVLLSGGGSAHLTLPAESLSLEDVRSVTRGLQRAGAAIDELNAVRKHCEALKGGRLAAACGTARIVTLAMSDVEGDRPDVIASGPTVGDPTTYAEAIAVLDKYGAGAGAVREHLLAGERGEHPETIKPGDPVLARTSWHLIANNGTVLDAVAKAAAGLGLIVVREDRFVSGAASDAGKRFGTRLAELVSQGKPACLIAGGEPVVNVGSASGAGGPSQEFALAAALSIAVVKGVQLAALSTDGVDGPPEGGNDHAGAIVDGTTVERARAVGLDAAVMLSKHDSATFFAKLGDAVRTGPTGTNLNHIFIGLTG
jgi:glycerate 2-kinase